MKFGLNKGTFFKRGAPRWAFVFVGEGPVATEGEECRAEEPGATFKPRGGIAHA